MRATIELDEDTAHAVQELRREHGGGSLSGAVNELIRRGMLAEPKSRRFEIRTRKLGIRTDVSNVANALDRLEGPGFR